QILVSADTQAALNGGLAVRDLGTHELRGLPRPEQILQLVESSLELDFPPLRLAREPVVEVGEETKAASLRIVLAEDSVLLREGIARLLEDGGFEVVGQAGNAEALLLKVRSYSPLVGRRRRDDPLGELTPREREVLELMAEGRSNHAIAEQLVVTERAIEKHVTSIFGKLRLTPAPEDHRRVLAVLAYLHG